MLFFSDDTRGLTAIIRLLLLDEFLSLTPEVLALLVLSAGFSPELLTIEVGLFLTAEGVLSLGKFETKVFFF